MQRVTRRVGCAGLALVGLFAAACGSSTSPSDGSAMDSGTSEGGPRTEGGVPIEGGGPVIVPPTGQLDLLFVIDNSGSMADNQSNFLAQVRPLIDRLTNPPCRSRANPSAPEHACNPMNPDDVRVHEPATDLHVGVVSTDLGTPGSMVPGCDDPSRGDHGLLNPIRNGFALQSHLPWAPRRPNAVTAPSGFRPMVCNNDINQFPSFITFCSNSADRTCDVPGLNMSTRDPDVFSDWFKCNAGIFINGCGLESQLESAWRALVHHDARQAPGNMSPNAGFVRPSAVLAIVMLTDEEDGSVRDCNYDQGFSSQNGDACDSALDIYNTSSMAWAHPTNPDLRFYLYTPGDRRDPTWNLDRYVNSAPSSAPNRWAKDFLSLKPGHPERVVFAAITGVPLAVPTRTAGTETVTNWDALLGTPSGSPDNFYGRDSSMAISGMQESAGPFSMRTANMDPNCSHVVPACRRAGSTYNPMMTCSNAQSMAFPSRRLVEIARRFDESVQCGAGPCRNGMVASICATNLSAPIQQIANMIGRRVNR
ncbi:MAG: hypothetical protein JNK05_39640 [Myxococcales bacterium]|nr:hypothetical protein [Myxococcales bacterium]